MNLWMPMLLAPAVAISLLGLFAGCLGAPWDCPLPAPDPVPRPRAALHAIANGSVNWGPFPPVPRDLLDRAVERSISQPPEIDRLQAAAILSQTYDHPGLRDYLRNGYKWLLYHSGDFNSNRLRIATSTPTASASSTRSIPSGANSVMPGRNRRPIATFSAPSTATSSPRQPISWRPF